MLSCYDRTPACDGQNNLQTDRRTQSHNTCRASTASRDKLVTILRSHMQHLGVVDPFMTYMLTFLSPGGWDSYWCFNEPEIISMISLYYNTLQTQMLWPKIATLDTIKTQLLKETK